ncbi:MAG: hypothetical protein ACRDRN_09985 [Sciscionella sp.]
MNVPSGQQSHIDVAELLVALAAREQQARDMPAPAHISAADTWAAAQDLVRGMAGWPREADSDRV